MPRPSRRSPHPRGGGGGLGSGLDRFNRTIRLEDVKARAHGQWESILAALAPQLAPAIARLPHHVPCPVHGGKDGFRLHRDAAETGGGICNTCPNPRTGNPSDGFPDGFDVLQWANGWDFRQALEAVAGYLGMAPGAPRAASKAPSVIVRPNPAPVLDTKALEALERVWGESIPASHPDAEPMRLYLDRRGVLLEPIPPVLRFHRSLEYWHPTKEGYHLKLGSFPAMLALMVNPQGQGVAIHRTFLDADGFKATPSFNGYPCVPRKMMRAPVRGASNGGAVRLFEPGSVLAVAEGIETAIAYYLMTGTPAWSALNAGGLERVELPASVREVWIAADQDGNDRGLKAAQVLARRLHREGRAAYIHLPKERGDWNDVLLKAARDDG